MSVVLSDVNVKKRTKSGVGINNPGRMRPLEYYLSTARKVVSRYSSKSVAAEILSDEDAISHIAEHIMLGTSRWDETKGKTLDNYHIQCALWAIKRWISKKSIERNKHILSLDYTAGQTNATHRGDSFNLHEVVSDKRVDKDESERLDGTVKFAQEVLNLNCLTSNQRDCIKMMYIDGLTLREIGEKLGKTFQAVQQAIHAGLAKIKNEYNVQV